MYTQKSHKVWDLKEDQIVEVYVPSWAIERNKGLGLPGGSSYTSYESVGESE